MRITLIQTDIRWEDKAANLNHLQSLLASLKGQTHLAVLPEMFSTGFSMNTLLLAETNDGQTMRLLRQWASDYEIAIAGSYMATDGYHCYNRGFLLTPDGTAHYADKRHLFRMSGEPERYTGGTDNPIIPYMGWNIRLLVCYDLRFPVWSRVLNNDCDLLLYVANWPASRRRAWDALLPARAIENLCYVCGVNRVGVDGNGYPYNGGSILYSPKGEPLATVPDNEEGIATATLDLESLHHFRTRFPAWMDADSFRIL